MQASVSRSSRRPHRSTSSSLRLSPDGGAEKPQGFRHRSKSSWELRPGGVHAHVRCRLVALIVASTERQRRMEAARLRHRSASSWELGFWSRRMNGVVPVPSVGPRRRAREAARLRPPHKELVGARHRRRLRPCAASSCRLPRRVHSGACKPQGFATVLGARESSRCVVVCSTASFLFRPKVSRRRGPEAARLRPPPRELP